MTQSIGFSFDELDGEGSDTPIVDNKPETPDFDEMIKDLARARHEESVVKAAVQPHLDRLQIVKNEVSKKDRDIRDAVIAYYTITGDLTPHEAITVKHVSSRSFPEDDNTQALIAVMIEEIPEQIAALLGDSNPDLSNRIVEAIREKYTGILKYIAPNMKVIKAESPEWAVVEESVKATPYIATKLGHYIITEIE